MIIEIQTTKGTYYFKKTSECRKEIANRIHVYSGALIPLIIRAFETKDEHLKRVHINRSLIL